MTYISYVVIEATLEMELALAYAKKVDTPYQWRQSIRLDNCSMGYVSLKHEEC